MTSGQPEQFELVFDGPLDESPDTLRRLKGVFIAELEFTIDQTIQVLQKFPVTVKRSDSEQSLTKYFNALESAGAKVLLVRPKVIEKTEPSPSEPVTVGDTELWEVDNSQNDKLIAAHTAEELAPITIKFSIDPAEAASPVDTGDKPTARPKTTQVYELTDDMDLATALREAEAAPSPIQDHTEIPSETESAVAQSTLQEVIPVPSESVSLPLVTEPIAASLEIAETPTIEVSPPAPVAPAEVVASSPATQAWTLELELDELHEDESAQAIERPAAVQALLEKPARRPLVAPA